MSLVALSRIPGFCPDCRTIHAGACSREAILELFGSLIRRLDHTIESKTTERKEPAR